MSRKISVVTSSRADFSHLYWVLKELQADAAVELSLHVMGAHLSAEFGATVSEIEEAGFTVTERVECLLSSDTDVGMAKTIGVATLSFADVLARERPELLLLIADRYEMLAPASVALALRIPMAHIEGGEVSEGAIDHAVRNALTMMSHIHLVPTATARRRVLAMGEEEWRVHQVGAPSLDHLRRSTMRTRDELEQQLGIDLTRDTAVVAYHPVTLSINTTTEADAVFAALQCLQQQIVFCFPNSDAGSRQLIDRAARFCDHRGDAHLHVNLDPITYWSLLRHSNVMIGNSSSGIMESPSLALPTVNIGMRQDGRERAANIIDTPPESEAIVAAIGRAQSEKFRTSLEGMVSPYGDGTAAARIAGVLRDTPLDDLLVKRVGR